MPPPGHPDPEAIPKPDPDRAGKGKGVAGMELPLTMTWRNPNLQGRGPTSTPSRVPTLTLP